MLDLLKNIDINELNAEFLALGITAYIIGIISNIVTALFGYKIQKFVIALMASVCVFLFVVKFLSTIYEDMIMNYIISGILSIIVFVVVVVFYIKLVSFIFALIGATIGYFILSKGIANKMTELIGDTVPYIDIISKIVVALIAAAICGVLAKFVFKWLVIVSTSFGGAAGVVKNSFLLANQPLLIKSAIGYVCIIVLGVACCIFQIKRNKNSN